MFKYKKPIVVTFNVTVEEDGQPTFQATAEVVNDQRAFDRAFRVAGAKAGYVADLWDRETVMTEREVATERWKFPSTDKTILVTASLISG